MSITPAHRAYLNSAAITDEVIEAAGVRSVLSREDLPEGLAKMTRLTPVPGILFPYRDREGNVIAYRYRPDEPAPDPKREDKPAKYVGEPGKSELNHTRKATGSKVLVVEGEKQQLAARSHAPDGFGVVGIPGCWAWKGADLSWADGKAVCVAFDADRHTNPKVARAAWDFVAALEAAGATAVQFLDVPGDGTDGLDDALARVEPDERASTLREWIKGSTKAEPLDEEEDEEEPDLSLFGIGPEPEAGEPDGESFAYDGPERNAVLREAARLYVNRRARALVDDRIARETGRAIDWEARAVSGADWLDADEPEPKPLWGTPDTPLWLPGESLTIVGPPSVGKSTLAHAVMWGALGLAPDVIGFPIEPLTEGGILYLAMDRPKQIKRAMMRFVRANPDRREEIMTVIRERLTIWEGPLPGDITTDKRLLISMAERFGRTRIVVDSIKDVLPNASDEARAGGYNIARQESLAEGLEWVELHHNRKSGADNKEPNTLDDVYGSRWITAGAGSVLSLFGQPGEIVLRLAHLKPLGEPIFPTWVQIERHSGLVTVHEEVGLDELLRRAGANGITAEDATRQLYGIEEKRKPTKSQIQNVRNKLNRMITAGTVKSFEKLNSPLRYRSVRLFEGV